MVNTNADVFGRTNIKWKSFHATQLPLSKKMLDPVMQLLA